MTLARSGRPLRPFRPTPDSRLFVATAPHAAALAGLRDAHDGGEAFALLDGAAGLGKSVTALAFLESLDDDAPRLYLPSARFTRPAELLQSILFDADLPYQGKSDHELRLAVTDLLLTRMPATPTVLVIDEAHDLPADVLEELRQLGNLGTHAAPALFTVLVAWPGLRERLAKPDLAALGQRLGRRLTLDPLTDDESAEFLQTQLDRADDPDALDGEAAALAVAAARGVPRVLNQLAAAALRLAESRPADAEAMLAGMAELGLVAEDGGDEVPMGTVPFGAPRPAPAKTKPAPKVVQGAESRSGKRRKTS
jgi:general secretion pathway protein A